MYVSSSEKGGWSALSSAFFFFFWLQKTKSSFEKSSFEARGFFRNTSCVSQNTYEY